MPKFYVTTAIPYVNAKPHIGFALELIQADVVARYRRQQGDEVWFLTGTDENALKNVQAAEKAGVATREFVDSMSEKFHTLTATLNISNDDFIRTTEGRHVHGAQKLWVACRPEDIYRKSYTGLYCVGCEQFYVESELVDGLCPEHKTKPEFVSEDNYFFRLSNYQKRLEKLIASGELEIIPETRKNEVLAFVRRGLDDFSISRSRERAHEWGVAVPGDESQVMYVWFDALSNYLTALGYADNAEQYQKFWVHNPDRLHVIGKGISRFHCVYWPAMLMSAGLPLPRQVFIHGYVTVGGQKISKSIGNTVDPVELVGRFGAEQVRYYLLREIPAYEDGDFSEERFKQRYESDLANGLGNTFSRVTNMAEKFCGGKVPSGVSAVDVSHELKTFSFDLALQKVSTVLRGIDQDIDQRKPWDMVKRGEPVTELITVWVKQLRGVAVALEPFMPETSQTLTKSLTAKKITKATPLFPRLT